MILFKNARVVDPGSDQAVRENQYVGVEDDIISYVGPIKPEGNFSRIIDCSRKTLMPGLYNLHSHIPMTLFRGYAEELPLEKWLNDRIFPAEAKLTPSAVYDGTMLGIAEMLASGTVSFSDMYFLSDNIARAVMETGIKANLSKALVCFNENGQNDDGRFDESLDFYNKYNNSNGSKIKVDYAIHAIYTSNEKYISKIAQKISASDTGVQYHISETQNEHFSCIEKYGRTPTKVFYDSGIFSLPGIAAHCVWVTDEDMDIIASNHITVAHNPTSNLKLGSGIANIAKMIDKGINVVIGTDGCASNNNLNMFEEIHLAALLQKGVYLDPTIVSAIDVLKMATVNGAKAQRRFDCAGICAGKKADIILIDTDKPHFYPGNGILFDLVYSAQGSDVFMTMVDGKILYENGEYTTIDIEKVKRSAMDSANLVTGN